MSESSHRDRICLLYAGGTIEAVPSPSGLHGDLSDRVDPLQTLMERHPDLEVRIGVIEAQTVLRVLSESMSHGGRDWLSLADAVLSQVKKGVNRIVITHGTDTMEYTAAALSFLLLGFDALVILTGANFPIDSPRADNDACSNLSGALLVARRASLVGVYVYFNQNLWSGLRVAKISEWDSGQSSFWGLSQRPIGRMEGDRFLQSAGAQEPRSYPQTRSFGPPGFATREAAFFAVLPDQQPSDLLRLIEADGRRAILIQLYDSGTAPAGAAGSYSLIQAIQRARELGIVVFGTTRGAGSGDLCLYESSRELCAAGLIPLRGMTTSCAWVKLRWVLSWESEAERVVEAMKEDLAGELGGRGPLGV